MLFVYRRCIWAICRLQRRLLRCLFGEISTLFKLLNSSIDQTDSQINYICNTDLQLTAREQTVVRLQVMRSGDREPRPCPRLFLGVSRSVGRSDADVGCSSGEGQGTVRCRSPSFGRCREKLKALTFSSVAVLEPMERPSKGKESIVVLGPEVIVAIARRAFNES